MHFFVHIGKIETGVRGRDAVDQLTFRLSYMLIIGSCLEPLDPIF